VALDWNEGPFILDTTRRHPVFCIEAEGQKSRRSELAPVAPDFCEWILAQTRESQRVGKVFPLVDPNSGKPYAIQTVGPIVSAIGRKAGVVVGTTEKPVEENGKRVKSPVKLFAGAHDLRRAFCSRWAMKVKTPVLQRLARHAHISTTMSYYVSLTADEIGADLWAAWGQKAGENPATYNNTYNMPPKTTQDVKAENRPNVLS
jgi:integrase